MSFPSRNFHEMRDHNGASRGHALTVPQGRLIVLHLERLYAWMALTRSSRFGRKAGQARLASNAEFFGMA